MILLKLKSELAWFIVLVLVPESAVLGVHGGCQRVKTS